MFSPTRTAASPFGLLTVKACYYLDQFTMAFAILMRISMKLKHWWEVRVWIAFLKLFPASLREEIKDLYVVLKIQAYRIKGPEDFKKMCILCYTLIFFVKADRMKVINSYLFTLVPLICMDFHVNVFKSCDHLQFSHWNENTFAMFFLLSVIKWCCNQKICTVAN